jgi:hypothetical protein
MKKKDLYNVKISRYQAVMEEMAQLQFRRGGREGGFKCVQCKREVPAESFFSHVQNRNHCPWCLWSRHLDLHAAGDRLCACKGAMRPVALTLKQHHKRYSRPGSGELMLVHVCEECGASSINRIAADDRADLVLDVYQASLHLAPVTRQRLSIENIRLLAVGECSLVLARLGGNSCERLQKEGALAGEAMMG